MDFNFKYKLLSKQELHVEVDASGKDLLVSLAFPYAEGIYLESLIRDALLEREQIEEKAWEEYRERLKELRENQEAV